MSVLQGREAAVVAGYRSGQSARALAAEFGVGDRTIARLLNRHEVPRRTGQPVGQLLASAPEVVADPRIGELATRPAELAYIAGLIDGEGCLLIYRKLDRRRTPHLRCAVTVSNTSKRVVMWLQDRLGGTAVTSNDIRAGHLPVFHWRCEGPRMAQLLTVVRPYLVIKPELAQLLIDMQSTLAYGTTGCRLPHEIRQQREALFTAYQQERKEMKGR